MTSGARQLFDVRRGERAFGALMSASFFLVITSFWILKPLKKSLFIRYYDEGGLDLLVWHLNAAQAELLAKVLNMGVAFVAVVVFSALATRLRRQQLTYVFTAFFLASYAVFAAALNEPAAGTVWTFYLFGDLFSTLMVATFFAFLNDSVTPDVAKRLYGVVGLGGVLGGVFGTTTLSAMIRDVSPSEWLGVTAGLGVGIAVLAGAAGRLVDRKAPAFELVDPSASLRAPGPANPAVAGARLVFRSRYLLSLVAIVGLYEMVSTLLDFQFTSTIAHYLDGPAIGEQFARVFAITNGVSLVVQLLLTSLVMRRFGLTVALLALPVAVLSASTAFMILPGLWLGSLLNTADNGLSYSIHQSAKEALYVPTTRDEKYKAKAFVDMFVQRFAKALAVGLSLVVTTWFADFSSVRWLSLLTLPLIAAWVVAIRYAGRRFDEMTGGEAPPPIPTEGGARSLSRAGVGA